MNRFSTAAFPERGRYARFRESLRRHIVGLDIGPLVEDQYWSNAVAITLPGLGVVTANAMPATLRRELAVLAAWCFLAFWYSFHTVVASSGCGSGRARRVPNMDFMRISVPERH